jgi:broad specificity phosphatase PhoE
VSTLYLVRHGQAAFGADDYDVLSPLGTAQGSALGAFWARWGVRLDAVYVGPRRRHEATAAALLAGLATGSQPAPPLLPLPSWDEFDFGAVLAGARPTLETEYQKLKQEIDGVDPLRHRRSFDRLFNLATSSWVRGELDHHVPESFSAFQARVRGGLHTVMQQQGRGKTVAVVASAGPISVALQSALGVSDEMTLRLCATMANTAVSELRYRSDSLSMLSFNSIAHLPEPGLLTHR